MAFALLSVITAALIYSTSRLVLLACTLPRALRREGLNPSAVRARWSRLIVRRTLRPNLFDWSDLLYLSAAPDPWTDNAAIERLVAGHLPVIGATLRLFVVQFLSSLALAVWTFCFVPVRILGLVLLASSVCATLGEFTLKDGLAEKFRLFRRASHHRREQADAG